MNDLTFTQISTVLNSIVSQATGQAQITPTDTGTFTAVAQTGLLAGYDNLLNAISQVLSRTIFSIRPYTRKLQGLEVSTIKYGNHVRKLQIADSEWKDDQRLPLTEGESVDQMKVHKPNVLQTNFYGQAAYERFITIFKDQLDVAFSSPEEFGRFTAMVMNNASDQIEQAHEELARGCLANLIGGTILAENSPQIVHLLTEYNAATGGKYTATTIMQPETYKGFIQWAFARIAEISSMLTERSAVYHTNVTGKTIMRHTPYAMQRVFLYAKNTFQIEAMVRANTFHDNFLSMAVNEIVNFWQSIQTPSTINVTATYMKSDGTLTTGEVNQANIFGVIFDEEAAGYTVVNQWAAPTPFNAAAGYSDIYWHFTDRYWNDFTENCVVLLLD